MLTRSQTKLLNMPLTHTPVKSASGSPQPVNTENVSLLDLEIDDLNRSIGLDNPSSTDEITSQTLLVQSSSTNTFQDLDERISKVATTAVSSALADMMQNLSTTLTNRFETMFQQQTQQCPPPPTATSSPTLRVDNVQDIRHFNQMMENCQRNDYQGSISQNYTSIDKAKIASNIARWNVKFNGDTRRMTVSQFLFRVTKLRTSFGYSEENIFDNFHLLVEEKAQNWYWNYSSTHPLSNYDDLIRALRQHYDSLESEFELLRKLYDLKQRDNDSFDYFYNEVLHRNSLLPTPKTDDEIMDIIRHNVKLSVRQMIFAYKANNLHELAYMCRSAENLMKNNNHSQRPNIHEIETKREDCTSDSSIDAFNRNSQRREHAENQCRNCISQKHPPKETVHCFKCGLENTVTPDCPRCKHN